MRTDRASMINWNYRLSIGLTRMTERVCKMKFEDRDVAFDVHQQTDERWEWIVYPKAEKGTRFSGASPTEAEAKKAACQGIDEWLGK
jgi:hypothetical protein